MRKIRIVGHPKNLPGFPKSTRFTELDLFKFFFHMLKGEIANSKDKVSLRICTTVDIRRKQKFEKVI